MYELCFNAITIIIVVERANWRNHMMSDVFSSGDSESFLDNDSRFILSIGRSIDEWINSTAIFIDISSHNLSSNDSFYWDFMK